MSIQHDTQVSINSTSFTTPLAMWSFENQPVPLVKIYTCGGLRIEVLQQPADSPAQAQYALPSALSGRGVAPAQVLLKHLLSAPKHYCSVDWLQEHWYTTDELPTRFDNRASYLRGMLCPPYLQGEQREHCRRQLVSFVSGSEESGKGYRLGAYPLIWVDVDALDWNIQQACRMERYGDDAFPFWERAYQLASQGVYLPEEAYSDWAEPRRSAVMGALRQSVHALKRLYLIRHGEQGQAEMMRLLRDYLLQFPTDEDALRSLVELLGAQERFQEIEQMFIRTKRYVEEEGNTLDARTLDIWAYLRTKQIQRQHMGTSLEMRSGNSNTQDESIAGIHSSFTHMIAEGIAEGITKAIERLEQREEKNETTSEPVTFI